MSFNRFYGWDIGGAHLKVATLTADGRVAKLRQYATPLWQGLGTLESRLAVLAQDTRHEIDLHAVTMTGELVDAFPDRASGVERLLQVFAARHAAERTLVYTLDAGLQPPDAARGRPLQIASMNWHATATVAAAAAKQGILLDIGSTTTDIVPFRDGRVCAQGVTDRERLQCDELVYTGVARTPVMAAAQRVLFAGRWQNLAAELFATFADVHRLTGELPDDADLYPPADGGARTRAGSLTRLARMAGADDTPELEADVNALAHYLARLQQEQITTAAQRVCRAAGSAGGTVIGAGSGLFLARRCAAQAGMDFRSYGELFAVPADLRHQADVCASALAVAQLARDRAGR
jgi:probable H4MPT-linked C1 transfer pathway protein